MTRIIQIAKDIVAVSDKGDFSDTIDLVYSEDDGGWYFQDPATMETSKIFESSYEAIQDWHTKGKELLKGLKDPERRVRNDD